jgi:hypothetical protein
MRIIKISVPAWYTGYLLYISRPGVFFIFVTTRTRLSIKINYDSHRLLSLDITTHMLPKTNTMNEAQDSANADSRASMPAVRCCRRFRDDLRLGFFQEEDHDGRLLDLKASFCLDQRNWLLVIIKFAIYIVVTTSFVYGIFDDAYPYFHFTYISYWSLAWLQVYLTLSLLTSLFACCSSRKWLIHQVWLWFSIASVHLLVVVVLFWFFEYDSSTDDANLRTIMDHGGTAVLVLIDGLLVNRIPVRLNHIVATWFLAILWMIWSILHDTVVKKNPYSDNPDDPLYAILKWEEEPLSATVLCVITLLVAIPIIHIFVWYLSLLGRRYKDQEESTIRRDGIPHGEVTDEFGYNTKSNEDGVAEDNDEKETHLANDQEMRQMNKQDELDEEAARGGMDFFQNYEASPYTAQYASH